MVIQIPSQALFSLKINTKKIRLLSATVLVSLNGSIFLGPVVQSTVSLRSSLVVKMLTVLINSISNSQVFLQMQKLLTFFKQKY